jgi:hypothetical protein
MKLSKLFMIALLAGTLGVIGCGDDATGTGNTNGGGGDVCDACENQSEIPLCEGCLRECTDTNPNDAGCAALAVECCNIT